MILLVRRPTLILVLATVMSSGYINATQNPSQTVTVQPTQSESKVQVGTDGLIHDPTLIQSSGNADADNKALAAISRWKFKPATQDGVPVGYSLTSKFGRTRNNNAIGLYDSSN